jgi:hypothetical protein
MESIPTSGSCGGNDQSLVTRETAQSEVRIMTTVQTDTSADPRRHTANIKRMLTDVANHARDDVDKVDDPKAQALFETTAEVLRGLVTAYDHFEGGTERAWR